MALPFANTTAAWASARASETQVPELIAVTIAGPVLATVFVAMRVYTRVFLVKKHFLEDYSIVASLACTIAMSVFTGLTVMHGFGRHYEFVSPEDRISRVRVGLGVIQFYSLTHFFTKLSIMLQYYRVTVLPWEKRLCYAIIAALALGYFIILLLEMIRCIPFAATWDPASYPDARCVDFNMTAKFFASQALNMAFDLLILVAPLFILRHSTAPLQQKLLFGIALAFGGIACIVSILRFRTLQLSTTSNDPTWDKLPSSVYGTIECNLGIICACVVTLRPLFQSLRRLLFGVKPPERRAPTPPHWARDRTSPYDVAFEGIGSTYFGGEDCSGIRSENRDTELDGMESATKTRTDSTAETVILVEDRPASKDCPPNNK